MLNSVGHFQKECNLCFIQQMWLLDQKPAQCQFRWIREEDFNSSRVLSSISRSGPLKLGDSF